MTGILKPLLTEPFKHFNNLLTKPEYFTYHWLVTRLRWRPRFAPFNIRLHKWNLQLPDVASFLSSYKAIFLDQIYAFTYEDNCPRILDLGANVGLSVLFFKMQHPGAVVVALEPDPVIFGYLLHNVHGNGLTDVELVNKAAWIENTRLGFFSDSADGGRIIDKHKAGIAEIEAIDIRELLAERRFDFLKMDIEGAESVVLPACQAFLGNLRYLFVEFHSWKGEPQHFASVLDILEGVGFRLSMQVVWASPQPFLERKQHPDGFDFQANIFAWRE
jgi:FkbM family methyltransferase